MTQHFGVLLTSNNRVIPSEVYYLTKLLHPITYKEVEEAEAMLATIAKKFKRKDAYLVLDSNSQALKGKMPLTDPFKANGEK